MQYVFYSPTKIVFGEGCLRKAGEEAEKLGKRVLVVTGRSSARKSGSLNTVVESLVGAGLSVEVFDKVEPDPSIETIEYGARVAREWKAELVIGLGGGSPMDAAKAIALLVTNKGKVEDYFGLDKVEKPSLPILTIPTTAGTGSEVTKYSVITDREKKLKQLIGSPHIIPKVAMLDPIVTVSMPASVTGNTGMDALSHAIESFVSTQSNPVSDVLALEAIRIIATYLPLAVSEPNNLSARERMLFASLIAGMSLSSSGAGLVHGMGYSITTFYGAPHGLANALLMPQVMEFNLEATPAKFRQIAQAMGKKVEGLPDIDAAKLSVQAVRELCGKIGMPRGLGEIGVKKESLADFAMTVSRNERILTLNPRRATAKEIEEIYIRSM